MLRCRFLTRSLPAAALAACLVTPASADQPLHTSPGNDTREAAVAYDTARDRYLIVYIASGGRLEGKIRAADGTVVDDFISLLPPISGMVFREPRATYKISDDVFIVAAVMEDRTTPIVRPKLTVSVFEPDGALRWTRDLAGVDTSVVTPDIVADTFPDRCCILVTWQERRGSIAAIQFDVEQNFQDRMEIHNESSPTTYAFHPRIAYQRSPNDQFLIVYQHARGADSVLEARVVRPFATVPGPRQVVATLHENPSIRFGQRFRGGLDVAWDEDGDRYLASWLDRTSLRGVVLPPSGSPATATRTFFTERDATGDWLENGSPEVLAAPGEGRFLVSHPRKLGYVYGPSNPAWWIHGWWVDLAGTPTSVTVSTWWTEFLAAAPAGGWSPVVRKAFVAWQRNEPVFPPGPRDLYFELVPVP